VRRASLFLIALALAAFVSCREPQRPNIVWIVWDTVRADHLGLHGHDRDTTPNLDRWANGARVFEDCLSTAGYTLPSHASMFTGLLPSETCAHNAHPRLDDRYTTVAELLRSAGYRTYLYSANPHISSTGNFTQGFDRSEHPWSPRLAARAREMVLEKLSAEDESNELLSALHAEGRGGMWKLKATGALAQETVLSWLDAEESDSPFFVFLNYMEAHRPLIPPREYRERMMSPEEVDRSYRVNRSWMPTWEYTLGLREMDDDELELTRATYDAAVAELDDLFGKLIEALERGGHLEDTIVILTSDHGEHLGEQHMLDHQFSLYQPLLRVPLIVHYPSLFEPGRDARPVTNFDLFPTLLELAQVDPPRGFESQAVSLLEPLDERMRFAEDPAEARVVLTTVKLEHPDWDPTPWERQLRAVVDTPFKLIWSSNDRARLFDLSADPLELTNVSGPRDDVAWRLEQSLDEIWRSLETCDPGQPVPDLAPEEIERLKALGYFGG
jgi:arylsulfatase A-like enzyme